MEKFFYTHPNSRLSNEQREFYETNGYLVIKNNVPHDVLDQTRKRFLEICDNKVNTALIVMKDPSLKDKGVKGEYLINKIQDFVYDDVMWQYVSHSNVIDFVEGIIGPNITAMHSMFINKPPDANPNVSLHPLHQDLHYFPFRPPHKICASWTAVEDVNEENGCLYVVPGSHKGILYMHGYADGHKNKLYHGIHGLNVDKVNVVMKKGDTVFFHPLLLHGSGPNRTKGFRKAISCHYADSNCEFIDVRGTTQESIADEIVKVAEKMQMGANIKYIDIWKSKSRLVKGASGNFQRYDSHL